MTSHLTKLLYVPALMLAIAPAAYADPVFTNAGSCIGIAASGCVAVPTIPADAALPPNFGLFNTLEGRGPDLAHNDALLHVEVGPNSTNEFTSAARGNNTYSTIGMLTLTQSIPVAGTFKFTIQPGEVTVSRTNLSPTQSVEASLHISLMNAGILKFDTSKLLKATGSDLIIDTPLPGTTPTTDIFTLDPTSDDPKSPDANFVKRLIPEPPVAQIVVAARVGSW